MNTAAASVKSVIIPKKSTGDNAKIDTSTNKNEESPSLKPAAVVKKKPIVITKSSTIINESPEEKKKESKPPKVKFHLDKMIFISNISL